jgi:small conductance mechanosensitive channel
MNEINKYVAKYAELVIPWVLTSGVKNNFYNYGTLIQIKNYRRFYSKAVRIAVRPDGISSQEAEEKEKIH